LVWNQDNISRVDCNRVNYIKLVFVASPLNMHHSGERERTGWDGIRIMYPELSDMSTYGLLF
jgi:hypothetical protein